MKSISEDNKYWLQEEDGVVTIGLTPDYFARLGMMWVFVPTPRKTLKENEAFASIESSKFLGPLRLPVPGQIQNWNQKALESPETITPDDYLIQIKLPTKGKVKDEVQVL